MQKLERCRRNIQRLAEMFNVSAPEFNLVANPGCYGLYWRAHRTPKRPEPRNVITMSPRASLEALAHEFAHHLDHETGLGSNEPPASLPKVREAIAGPRYRHTCLEHGCSGVPAEWLK